MDDLIKKHLQDILTAIEEVEGFFGNAPKVYDDFYSNLCLRRAVERNIEIIGEAMNRILKVDKDIAITNSRKIVDARNYIIHGYDSLSVDILWSMVINHLPKLRNEVITLLRHEISYTKLWTVPYICSFALTQMYTICTIKNRKSQIKPSVDLQQMSYRSFPDNLSIKTASISFANS